jgi:hypothetical protein
VKQEIEKAFPGSKVEGNTKGSPRTGAFEVTDEKGNGTCLLTKLIALFGGVNLTESVLSLSLQVEWWWIPHAW